MSLAKNSESKISEADYLAGERISEIKHDYIEGLVYAMAGASENHNLISNNLVRELGNILKQKKSSCKVFSSDMKVRLSNTGTLFFYPDVMLCCEPDDNNDYYKQSPIIIVEVLSQSTRKNDKTRKKMAYINIPTLQEYIIIDQEFCEVEIFCKSNNWASTVYLLGDTITLASIDISLLVEDIYYQVNNGDMVQYLVEKEQLE
ncbi:MAG: Uma2 family endonuclease [Gammaproteobacteria bacterium]|nr:Uma2 family endonuclease [Gammaproteobacteria bacterium]